MGEIMTKITISEWCEKSGVSPDAVRMAFPKIGLTDFAKSRVLSPAEVSRLEAYEFRKKSGEVRPKKIVVVRSKKEDKPGGGEAAGPLSGPAPARAQKEGPNGWQKILLCLLLVAPTAASVNNMLHITEALAGNYLDAVLLTVVLSVSALGLVLAGVRSGWTLMLAVVLIAFESFCNLTRIYGGLMGVGTTGNPTRFLGLVTDIFNTGSHGTAIAVGAFTAFFIAAVQYAAVFQLNRK